MTSQSERIKSSDVMRALTARYWADIKQAPSQGRKVAWVAVNTPAEIFTSMDFNVVYPESYAAVCGARKVSTEFCQRAENLDYSPDLCSYARNSLGVTLSRETQLCPIGGVPKPDVLVAGSYCTAIMKWYEALQRFFDVPLVTFDLPYTHDADDKEAMQRSIDYLKDQMTETIAFLESFTKRKFDYDRLREHVAASSNMSKVWQQIIGTARNVPSPITVFDLFNYMFAVTCLRGNAKGVQYYELLKQELDEKVAAGVSAIPKEKYRLYWDNIAVWYKIRELSAEFASYDACLVTGIYPNTFSWYTENASLSQPLDYLANAILPMSSSTAMSRKPKVIAQYVKDYSIDGLIMQSSRTCKLMSQNLPSVLEAVEKETNVPGVIIEADMCDDRCYSEAQIKMQIKAFMELLSNRLKR